LEMMGKVRAIAFDKTGTLTTGIVQVFQVIPAGNYSQADVLKVAATVESVSEHAIGKAIVKAAADLNWVSAVEVQAIPGQGIVGINKDQQVIVGNTAFVQKYVTNLPEDLQKFALVLEQQGKTVVWVAQGGGGRGQGALRCRGQGEFVSSSPPAFEVIGLIAIADEVRAEAAATIARLKALGVEQIVMLTGDNQRTADSVAQALGINHVYAELLPEDKLHVIRGLQKQYKTVAMVGDGINDAPALAQASVGITMGLAGSDVALETADIVLMADRLEKLAVAMDLGRRSHSIVKQNIAVALSFIILLLVGNFLGNVNLPIGVIGHEGSTVLVTLSGLRLLK
ncbi:MAG: heavy metal translocating P-type ATPase, partial [Hassallia sp.]